MYSQLREIIQETSQEYSHLISSLDSVGGSSGPLVDGGRRSAGGKAGKRGKKSKKVRRAKSKALKKRSTQLLKPRQAKKRS